MIPVVKGWCTETAQDVASLGVQVHGGMGFVEETGAAQYLRDARITTIYEGTTGIQANDLVGRKIARDGGEALAAAIARVRSAIAELEGEADDQLRAIAARLAKATDALADAGRFAVDTHRSDPRTAQAGAVPMLELAGIVFAGAELARAAGIASRKLAAGDGDAAFLRAKIATARHFADHRLTRAPGLREAIVAGAHGTLALAAEDF
jgi:hypothetical protein